MSAPSLLLVQQRVAQRHDLVRVLKVIGDLMALGIVIGIVGIAMVSVNYLIYRAILKSRKKPGSNVTLAKKGETPAGVSGLK